MPGDLVVGDEPPAAGLRSTRRARLAGRERCGERRVVDLQVCLVLETAVEGILVGPPALCEQARSQGLANAPKVGVLRFLAPAQLDQVEPARRLDHVIRQRLVASQRQRGFRNLFAETRRQLVPAEGRQLAAERTGRGIVRVLADEGRERIVIASRY
jgi:hypothetical protein